jgi:hypothetical protein
MEKLSGENRKKMRKAFNQLQNLECKTAQMKREFDEKLKKFYGEEHYSDHDEDEIIDSLDYGQGGLSFQRFDEIMWAINNQGAEE